MSLPIHPVPASKDLNWVTQSLDVAGRRPGLVLSAMLLGLFILVLLAFGAALPGAVLVALDGADNTLGLPFNPSWMVIGLPVLGSEEHTSEIQSLMRTSYAVCCLKKKKQRSNTLIYIL